jgi:hypothetical protein
MDARLLAAVAAASMGAAVNYAAARVIAATSAKARTEKQHEY